MRFYVYIFCWVFCLKGLALLNDLAKDYVFKWPVHIVDKSLNFLFLLKMTLMVLGVFRGIIWLKDRTLDAPATFKNAHLGVMVVMLFLALLLIGSIFSSATFEFLPINNYSLLYLIVTSLCVLYIALELNDQMRRLAALHKNFDETKKSGIKALCKKLIKEAQSSIGLVYRELNPDSKGMVSAGELMAQPWEFACFLAEELDVLAGRPDVTHIVIGKNKYELFNYSSDSREPGNLKVFTNAIDLARYCASMQINVAVRIALLADPRYVNSESGKTFEDLQTKTYLLMDYQEMLKEKLSQCLKTGRAKAINWFLNYLLN